MRKGLRVTLMVVAGVVGGYLGYWLGDWAGWSTDADWPFRIGGGTGAILTSAALALLGVWLTAGLLGRTDHPARTDGTDRTDRTDRADRTGAGRRS